MFGLKQKDAEIDLPIKRMWAASKVEEDPYLDTFKTRAEAENYAKKAAQKSDSLFAVYEINLIGAASPNASTYEELK